MPPYDLLDGILADLQTRYNSKESIFTPELLRRWRVQYEGLSQLKELCQDDSHHSKIIIEKFTHGAGCFSRQEHFQILNKIVQPNTAQQKIVCREMITGYLLKYPEEKLYFGDLSLCYPGIVRFDLDRDWSAFRDSEYGYIVKTLDPAKPFVLHGFVSKTKVMTVCLLDPDSQQNCIEEGFSAYIYCPALNTKTTDARIYIDTRKWKDDLKPWLDKWVY